LSEIPTQQFRFDDRVAVVTGAGRGLGRAYAQLLASRGAKVVVNDSGGSLAGDGADAGPAEHVANEITAAGGEAVACTASVATREGGEAIISTALEHYGGIDILVHNAGNVRSGSLKEMSYEDFDAVLDGLRAHRADVVNRRAVRKPRCCQLRGREGRRDRVVERRGA
jgi:NAD(P)-dependent dehydrogenase (short-subunit alcohol dehydrogenase family)